MTINQTSRQIQYLLRNTNLTKSQIAREVGVDRQRVTQVQQYIDENPYTGFDGAKLKERREKAGMSMGQLARLLRCRTSQVSRWESGEQTPWPNNWRRIARALRCTVQDLEREEMAVSNER